MPTVAQIPHRPKKKRSALHEHFHTQHTCQLCYTCEHTLFTQHSFAGLKCLASNPPQHNPNPSVTPVLILQPCRMLSSFSPWFVKICLSILACALKRGTKASFSSQTKRNKWFCYHIKKNAGTYWCEKQNDCTPNIILWTKHTPRCSWDITDSGHGGEKEKTLSANWEIDCSRVSASPGCFNGDAMPNGSHIARFLWQFRLGTLRSSVLPVFNGGPAGKHWLHFLPNTPNII